MDFMVGIFLALAVSRGATVAGLERERGFYPVLLIVIAACYILFAVLGGTAWTLGAEMVPAAAFVTLAILGLRKNLWIVVAALAGHGLFDLTHARLIADPGVPAWWPMFCLSYDVVAALYLSWRLMTAPTGAVRAAPRNAA